jgi:Phosphotransferase enzyme family
MTSSAVVPDAGRFDKLYPSVVAADLARHRSLAAMASGVPTPAVLARIGPKALSFERIVPHGQPTLAGMLAVLQRLNRMPPDGLIRFDPFLRIRPRLGAAPSRIRALVSELEAQDAALYWPANSVIHGDFHPGQTMMDRSGKVWLLDLDDLALAPQEADLGNLAAWSATCTEGNLDTQARAAMLGLLALAPEADPLLSEHFLQIALVRRALKLAGKGQFWALDQLSLRA